jgi:hypothetical protein
VSDASEIGRVAGRAPGLLELARERMRLKHLAYRTEQAYLDWIRRFIAFHGRRHPRDLRGGCANSDRVIGGYLPGHNDRRRVIHETTPT